MRRYVLLAVLFVGCAGPRAEQANERGKVALREYIATQRPMLSYDRNDPFKSVPGDVTPSKPREQLRQEAVSAFAEAVRLVPDNPRYHYNLGLALGHSGLNDQALLEFREAVRLKPDFTEASLALTTATRRIEGRQADRLQYAFSP